LVFYLGIIFIIRYIDDYNFYALSIKKNIIQVISINNSKSNIIQTKEVPILKENAWYSYIIIGIRFKLTAKNLNFQS
jgi:hypothetical protein